MKNLRIQIYLMLLVGAISSCVTSNEPIQKDIIKDNISTYTDLDPTNFTESVINISLMSDFNDPINGIKVSLWSGSPLSGGEVIFKGITDQSGSISTRYNVPNHLESLVLQLGYIGMPDFLIIPVDQLDAVVVKGFDHEFGVLSEELIPGQSQVEDGTYVSETGGRVTAASAIVTLGSYNFWGKPDYLLDRDVITSDLLEFVNASLPESKPVPDYHPAYLEDGTQTSLNILEDADVWMTFVSEGAGYKNSLGFYTYETGNPPATPEDIETLHIAFPNASFLGYGGQLRSGDKVHLGKFTAGTTIGFVLIADGYHLQTSSIKTSARMHYSDTHLNPEEDESKKQHTVLLWDDVNELFLIGFEDLLRNGGSDNDFNDAVFYITSNPTGAISRENVKPVDKPADADGDGVNDTYDEFPEDARYAYRYSYPGENSFGTFAFEDQWPGYGDYDFNDLVADYQFDQYANSENKMVLLKSNFVLKATGAGFHNALGVQLDLAPDKVASVTGSDISGDLFSFNGNGTEAGQDRATLVITDNAHNSFGFNGLINTDPSQEYTTPDTITVDMEFTSPQSLDAIGSAPYNPFIVINQTRGRELHLPGYSPTNLVDTNYFGQGNDGTDLANELYYVSKKNLPWAMNLPISFDYPEEKADIRDAYTHFEQWAKSGGFSYMDWYTNKNGYRNTEKIY